MVYLAERENIETIFTLDRRDFSVYRRSRGRVFPPSTAALGASEAPPRNQSRDREGADPAVRVVR